MENSTHCLWPPDLTAAFPLRACTLGWKADHTEPGTLTLSFMEAPFLIKRVP